MISFQLLAEVDGEHVHMSDINSFYMVAPYAMAPQQELADFPNPRPPNSKPRCEATAAPHKFVIE